MGKKIVGTGELGIDIFGGDDKKGQDGDANAKGDGKKGQDGDANAKGDGKKDQDKDVNGNGDEVGSDKNETA